MSILAIDPGSEQSGWVVYEDGRVVECGHWSNEKLVGGLGIIPVFHLAIEWVDHYGMAVGRDVFETCRWVGKFEEAWWGDNALLIPRREIKLELCGSARAKDSNVRAALIDRFGGRQKAIGRKAAPGPLYGVPGDNGHKWAALALAVVAEERLKAQAEEAA